METVRSAGRGLGGRAAGAPVPRKREAGCLSGPRPWPPPGHLRGLGRAVLPARAAATPSSVLRFRRCQDSFRLGASGRPEVVPRLSCGRRAGPACRHHPALVVSVRSLRSLAGGTSERLTASRSPTAHLPLVRRKGGVSPEEGSVTGRGRCAPGQVLGHAQLCDSKQAC